ncbi:MAG: helix-turn-helix domain-containing protein [Treponema sp.]|jgi:hypothetical protein|nr:helix-turn-helix domain-containing protein [Treponema sp.]
MAEKKYLVTLTKDEENLLRNIINKGKHAAQKRKRAQALLLAHEGYTGEAIAERAGMHRRGIEGLRQRFVEDGFEVSLEGKERGHRPRVLNGEDEARLAALVCMDECPKQLIRRNEGSAAGSTGAGGAF